jgi:hypothetical protein
VRGNGAVTLPRNRVHELAVPARCARDRLLPQADDVHETLVAAGQRLQDRTRLRQQGLARKRPLLGPRLHVEEVEIGASVRHRQQLMQARERVEDFHGQRLRGLRIRKPRDLANDGIGASQSLHGREGPRVRRSEQHDALDVFHALARHRRPRDETPHAVGHDHHGRTLGADAIRQGAPELIDAQPPVVVVKRRRESGDPQVKLQSQVRVEHHAE